MALALTKQELLVAQETMKWCLNYVVPAIIADPPEQPNAKVYANGTCSFFDTGIRKLAVTNWHVVEAFHLQKIKKRDVIFQLGPLIFDIENRLIDSDKIRDIAVMDITEADLKVINKQSFQCLDWPPERVKKDECVAFAGYPGIFRSIPGNQRILSQSVLMLELVADSSSEQFIIELQRNEWVKQLGIRDISELTSFGGFSGAAVFRLKNIQPIAVIEPVGIVFEHGETFDIHRIRHIDFINADGTIRS